MSVLQKGVLTVVGATLVASALILSNGKTTAEPKGGSNDGTTSLNAKNSVLKKSKALQSASLKAKDQGIILAPPPIGPFQIASPSRMVETMKLNGGSNSKAPNVPQKAIFKRSQPAFPDIKVKAPIAPKQAVVIPKMPVLSKVKPQKPQKAVASQLRPIMPSENKKRPINTHQQPRQPKQTSQTPFTVNPPVQRYMYVPVPMYQPQFAPQMPASSMYPDNSAKAMKKQKNNDLKSNLGNK